MTGLQDLAYYKPILVEVLDIQLEDPMSRNYVPNMVKLYADYF